MSVEVSPFAKVGGLADVAASLPKSLRDLGHDVRIAMPAYGMILENPRWQKKSLVTKLKVEINEDWTKEAFVQQTDLDGVPVYLIGTDEWFGNATRSDLVYSGGVEKYLFFSEAVLAATEHVGWRPDVVHCNDWHTGFLPVVMREKYSERFQDVASVFTIHNFAYQGEFGPEILRDLGLSQELNNPRAVEAWGRVNFLKAGCVFADAVNTVSPRYAEEIQTPEYGCHLQGLMQHLHLEGKLSGILNGIDREVFNPATDPDLPAHFDAAHPEGKSKCRVKLLKSLGLPNDKHVPIVGVVSRLSHQKGLDLLAGAAERLAEMPCTLIVQGLGDPWLVDRMRELEVRFPTRIRFVEAFDEAIAQLIYAGSDFFAMPSRFEPCGLGQMIALRYGTLPVVRRTGGLADTIVEGRNGFVFDEESSDAFLGAMGRAIVAFLDPVRWPNLVVAALETDFGWQASALRYVELYEQALGVRADLFLSEASA